MDDFNTENIGKRGQPATTKKPVWEDVNTFELEQRPAASRRSESDGGTFHFGSSTDEPNTDDLPDLPTKYDNLFAVKDQTDDDRGADSIAEHVHDSIEASYTQDTPIPRHFVPADAPAEDSADRAEPAPDQTEPDAYPHPKHAAPDSYLSQDEYDQPGPDEEPVHRRRQEPEKKRGGLLSRLKKRVNEAVQPTAVPAEEDPPEVMGRPDSYPDSDPADDYPEQSPVDTREAFDAETPDSGRLYTIHGGTRGKTEQEARELIADLQAKSGAADRRSRRSNTDYRMELNDLLGIESQADPVSDAKAYAAKTEETEKYDFDLDQAMDYDADVREYRGKNEQHVYQADAGEPEIDKRFNLGGQNTNQTISYANSAVDLSADEDYVPAQQTEYNPSQWTPDYDDPLAERQDTAEPPRKQHRSFLSRARRRAAPESAQAPSAHDEEEGSVKEIEVTDDSAGPAIYAVNPSYRDDPDYTDAPESIDNTDEDDEDFDDYDDESSRRYRESDMYAPPTFREYLLSILASVWLKLRGTVRGRTAATMRDSSEDLGDEVTPAEASKYYGSFLRSMRYRLRISGVALAVLLYISLEMPVPGMMKSLPVASAFCFGMQAVIMLLGLDMVTNAITNAVRLHFGADSLAVVSCFFTGLDALIVALSKTAAQHMPLCAISSASIVGLLLASYLSARGLRKATRVPAIGKHFFAVTGENTLEKDQITLLKSLRSVRGFVRRTEEAGPDETLYRRLAPALFVLALILSIIVMIAKKSYPEFIYILSAMLALTVPFGAMLSFSLPFFLGSNRIFKFGAAIAGWSGLCDIGASKNLIVTDRDLFPESAVSIESVRIFADEDAQKVISYAGSMMQASGCCAAGCFGELMRETYSPARPIDGFEVMPGGGMKGIIEGHVVLCGSTDLMRLMNVRIPFRLTDKTTVLLAIDGILYGIFSLKYEGQPQIRRALTDLVRTARPPVFAVRDFNVNPEMLHNTFDIATDGYDFPPYVERFRLSEPSEDTKDERIAAILCNEGLAPLTSVTAIGRSMFLATNINLILNVIASVLGVVLVFFRFLSTGANPLANLFLYMVFWTLPVLLVSFFVGVKR